MKKNNFIICLCLTLGLSIFSEAFACDCAKKNNFINQIQNKEKTDQPAYNSFSCQNPNSCSLNCPVVKEEKNNIQINYSCTQPGCSRH